MVEVDDSTTDASLGSPWHALIENTNTTANSFAMLGLRSSTADGGIAMHNNGTTNEGYMTFHVDAGGGADAERMRITNDGFVGIGCTPSRPLDVQSTTDTYISVVSPNTDIAGILLGDTDLDYYGRIAYDNQLDALQFWANNAERMRIASDGTITLNAYGAGYLKTDANGVISVDTDTIEDTLQSVTDRGASTDNAITISTSTNRTLTLDYTGGGTGSYSIMSFKQSGTEQFRLWGNYTDNYLSFYNDQASVHQLKLNSDGSTTFAGDVTLGSGSSETRTLTLQTNAEKDSIINFKESAATYGFSIGYYGVANDFIIKRHDNSTSGTDVFTLYRENNNATFAGNITVQGATTRLENNVTVGNSSGDYLETRYNDTANYATRLMWRGLQFGNNGVAKIVAGRTAANGFFEFYVNNTNDGLANTPDGNLALTIAANKNATFAGDVQIDGDLIVTGNTTSVNVEDLNVEQGEITLNYNASSDTSSSANGSGIRIQDAVDASNDATMLWDQTNSGFDFSHGATFAGSITVNSNGLLSTASTTSATTTTTIASLAVATYTAGFFDYSIKNGTNVRAGTVVATHDGTNVEFNETSTVDLGDTSDVTLSVDISSGDMRLRATTTSSTWTIKALIRGI
jgi:hypothetical protein